MTNLEIFKEIWGFCGWLQKKDVFRLEKFSKSLVTHKWIKYFNNYIQKDKKSNTNYINNIHIFSYKL